MTSITWELSLKTTKGTKTLGQTTLDSKTSLKSVHARLLEDFPPKPGDLLPGDEIIVRQVSQKDSDEKPQGKKKAAKTAAPEEGVIFEVEIEETIVERRNFQIRAKTAKGAAKIAYTRHVENGEFPDADTVAVDPRVIYVTDPAGKETTY